MFWIIAGGGFQGHATSAIRRDIVPLTVLLDGKLEKNDKVGKRSDCRQQPHLDVGKGCVEESCCSPCDWLNLGLDGVAGERDILVPVKFVMSYITRFYLQLTAVKGVAKMFREAMGCHS